MDDSPPQADRLARAGRYVRQPAGYRAFIPTPLPPRPPVKIDPEMQRLLSEADVALGRLDGSIQTLPNPDLFIFMYVRKEAVLSSQIEGTEASLNDVIKAEAELFSPERPSEVGEVLNYTAAMNHGLERLHELPLSLRLILEIHERLMQNVRGGRANRGELRRSQNWIGPRGCTLAEARFVPPPHEEAAKALGDLEVFLHGEDHTPPLLRIGLAHAQFETIHPFLDGNGRIGRLLITFFLCNKGFLQKPVLYLSVYLKANQDEYYNRLQAIRDRGEWEEWLKFFLVGVRDVARQATETSRRIVALRERHRQLIMDRFGSATGNAMRVLEYMYQRPYLSVNNVARLLGISYPNANSLVERFVANEILFETTGRRRNRVFWYSPYTELFSDLSA